jgi:hypothetical protein
MDQVDIVDIDDVVSPECRSDGRIQRLLERQRMPRRRCLDEILARHETAAGLFMQLAQDGRAPAPRRAREERQAAGFQGRSENVIRGLLSRNELDHRHNAPRFGMRYST